MAVVGVGVRISTSWKQREAKTIGPDGPLKGILPMTSQKAAVHLGQCLYRVNWVPEIALKSHPR